MMETLCIALGLLLLCWVVEKWEDLFALDLDWIEEGKEIQRVMDPIIRKMCKDAGINYDDVGEGMDVY